ncbi:MAG: hypothetical protein EOO07_21715 [Chitinophagaceae bacterium]|nr:MAG: hypothetical protein EOO07_21715 [Chitinophagaceae bacterium]
MIKKLLVIYLTTFLFAVVVCGGFKDGHFTENAFEAVLITLAYAFVMSGIDFFSRRMLVNLSRCWLHFPGNRTDFFLYMESKFFSGLGFLSVLNAGVIILLAWVGGYADYFLYCVAGLVILSLILLWNFYLGIYFYSRNRQGVEEINYRVFLVHAVIFIPAIAYLFLKYQNFNRLGVLDVVATCFVVTLIASLKLMRSNTIKQWQQADF